MKYSQFESVYQTYLDNGLHVIISPIKGVKSAVILTGYPAGAFCEEGFGAGSNDGISHFLEHMIFKGTPNISATEVNKKITQLGAETNALTTYDRTMYYSKAPRKNLPAVTELWGELFTNFTLISEEFESEKKVILQEIKIYEDMPNLYCGWKSRANLYMGTSLAHNIIGTQDSVAGITESMMEKYHSQYYAPEKTTVVIAGDISISEARELLELNFDMRKTREMRKSSSWLNFPPYWSPKQVYETKPSKHPLSYIGISWELPGVASDHYYPQLLLNTLIGNSKTSLLYKEIISKGICSTIEYKTDMFPPRSTGTLTYSSPPNQVELIYSTLFETIFEKLQTLSVSSGLIQRLKDEIKGRTIIESDDPLISSISLFERFNKHDAIISQQEYLKKINEVRVEDVKEALATSFGNLTFSVYAMGTIPNEWTPELVLR